MIRYGVYAGDDYPYEVWTEDLDHVKLYRVSGHRTSDEAQAAAQQYRASQGLRPGIRSSHTPTLISDL